MTSTWPRRPTDTVWSAPCTAAEVARLDAGSHFSPAFAGVRVPTLDAVFDLVGDRCQVNVEIKNNGTPTPGTPPTEWPPSVRLRNLYDQGAGLQLQPDYARQAAPLGFADRPGGCSTNVEMPTFFRAIWAGPPISPEAQHPEHVLIDGDFMAWAHGLGCKVNTWTVNDVAEARRLAALGVDTIMTDVPDLLLAGLREVAK